MSQENAGQVITEEQLVKSLATLENRAAESNEETAPVVQVQKLDKSASDTLSEFASEPLQKALDVSDVLDEVVTLMGVHVDRSLDSLQKSIQASANRDMSIITVLGNLKKSIDDNTAAIAQLMATPAGSAGTRPVTTLTGEVLTKSVASSTQAGQKKDLNPQELRKSVSAGLEILTRTAENPGERHRLSQATVKFESTGQIADSDMQAAIAAARK